MESILNDIYPETKSYAAAGVNPSPIRRPSSEKSSARLATIGAMDIQ